MSSYALEAAGKRQSHRGQIAIKRLIEKSPGFGALSLWVKYEDTDKDTALSWTTGKRVFFPARFEKLSLKEQVGVAAHELFHVAFRHVNRAASMRRIMTGFDGRLANIAMDAIINQSLKGYEWLELPGDPPILTELLKHSLGVDMNPEEALATWSFESLYRALHDKDDAKKKAKEYADSKDFEEDLDGEGEGQGHDSGDEAENAREAREWRDRLVRARAGDGTNGILRKALADLPKTNTPWEHVLRSKLTRALMPETEETWSRPSRRYMALTSPGEIDWEMPYEQGIAQDKPAMTLAVMVDTSGSIDETLFNRFAAEINSIQARTGATVHVIVSDCQVHGVWELKPEPGRKGVGPVEFKGHGGTDFAPAIEVANGLNPAIGVYLTDLQGPANVKCKFPIIWAVPHTFASGVEAPFGQLLVLD